MEVQHAQPWPWPHPALPLEPVGAAQGSGSSRPAPAPLAIGKGHVQGVSPRLTCPQSPPRAATSSGLPSFHLQQHSAHQERTKRASRCDRRSRYTPAPLDTSPGLSTPPREPPARCHRAEGAEETPPEHQLHQQGQGA